MFWTKGSIVAIRIPIYLHQSYARQWRSLYAHLWRHKQIILAVSTNMLICYHSAFGKPIHQLHLILAIERLDSESWPRAGNPGRDSRKTDRTEISILAPIP